MQSSTSVPSGTSVGTVPSTSVPSTASVRIQFRSIGNAPVLRKTKFKVGSNERIFTISKFLKTQLNLSENDSLWLYVPSTFAPAPDDTLGDLNQAFGIPLTTVPTTNTTNSHASTISSSSSVVTTATTNTNNETTTNSSSSTSNDPSTEMNTVSVVSTSTASKTVEKELILYYSITNAYG